MTSTPQGGGSRVRAALPGAGPDHGGAFRGGAGSGPAGLSGVPSSPPFRAARSGPATAKARCTRAPPKPLLRALQEQGHEASVDIVIVSASLVLFHETMLGEGVEVPRRRLAGHAEIRAQIIDARIGVAEQVVQQGPPGAPGCRSGCPDWEWPKPALSTLPDAGAPSPPPATRVWSPDPRPAAVPVSHRSGLTRRSSHVRKIQFL